MRHGCIEPKIPQAQSLHEKKNSAWWDLLINKKSIKSILKIFENNFKDIILIIVENICIYKVECH